MERSQLDQLHTLTIKERKGTDEQGIGLLARRSFESGINLALSGGVDDLNSQPHGASGRFRVSQCRPSIRLIGWIDEHGHPFGSGNKLTQEFQPLCHQLAIEDIDTCQIAARPRKARDKIKPDRVFGDRKEAGNRRGCRFDRECRRGTCGRDHGDLSANEIGRQCRQSIDLIFGETVFDRYVLAT